MRKGKVRSIPYRGLHEMYRSQSQSKQKQKGERRQEIDYGFSNATSTKCATD